MGKKKKKKREYSDKGYDQEIMNDIADSLEEYVYLYDMFIIKQDVDKSKYKAATKTIEKAIRDLRNGDGDKVFDNEQYEELMERLRNGL